MTRAGESIEMRSESELLEPVSLKSGKKIIREGAKLATKNSGFGLYLLQNNRANAYSLEPAFALILKQP